MPQSQGQAAPVGGPRPLVTRSRYELRAVAPYRLDLTVNALRRLPTNLVDAFTPGGAYLRLLDGAHSTVTVRVTQRAADVLSVTLDGHVDDHAPALALLRRVLGVDRDLTPFNRAAVRIPWLAPLASRMCGVKPPRYPSLWEACVNAVVFQQVSLLAASAIMRRLTVALRTPLEREGALLYAFPAAERLMRMDDDVLRAAGLSAGKLATLRRVGDALASGALTEAGLEERSSPDAGALLQRIKGIGPWTAAVILLRGLGRLDVFPLRDTSVARNLATVTGSSGVDVARILHDLEPQQGMLYFHLLLARLEARGTLGHLSSPAAAVALDASGLR
jgi:DNA-3-methyladenine glycosylase II